MASVFDVASYILEKTGEISTMKLQKLCYYSQAWSLVWDDALLFPEEIQAWVNGPVVRELFNEHKGMFSVGSGDIPMGSCENLTDRQTETIDAVLDAYSGFTGAELSEMTHKDSPWQEARQGVPTMAYCDNVISTDSMAEFYSAIAMRA